MDFVVNEWWLILLVFTPFVLGLLSGLKAMKSKMTEKLINKLSIDEFEKLLDD